MPKKVRILSPVSLVTFLGPLDPLCDIDYFESLFGNRWPFIQFTPSFGHF